MFEMILLAVLLATGPADGGEIPSDGDNEIREHLVVTAQFRPESARETLIEVEVLDAEDMAGDRDLRELLETELQMDVQQHRVFGSSLSIGGVTHENVEILVNGMPVLGRLDGIIDLQQIGLDAFERVEILKGPGSVYYGSDTQGGVVNLIPRRTVPDQPTLLLRAGFRDLGDEQQTLKSDFSLGQHGFSLTMARRHFDGEDETSETRSREWAERQQGSGSLFWRRDFADVSLSLFSMIAEEELTDLGEFNQGMAWDREYRTVRRNHQLTIDGVWRDRVHYHLFTGYGDYDRERTSYQSFEVDNGITPESHNDPAFANGFDMLMIKGMASITDLLPGLDAQVGLDWRREEGTGGRILDGSQELEDRAVFVGVRGHFGRWAVQPMVRIMDNTYDAPTTPALHIRYSGGGDLVWRTSYSRGFRGPSIKQLYLDFLVSAGPFLYRIAGNEDLQAERGHHYNTSLAKNLWSREKSQLAMELRGFYSDIDDLIALSAQFPDPNTPNLIHRNYINVDEQRSWGGDLSLIGTFGETRMELGLARIETFNALSVENPLREFNGRWDGRLEARHRLGNHRFSFLLKHFGEQPGFAEVSTGRGQPTVVEEVSIDAYDRIDLSWRYTHPNSGLSLNAGVKNLADIGNRDTVSLSSGRSHEVNHVDWGRRFQVAVTWHWKGHRR